MLNKTVELCNTLLVILYIGIITKKSKISIFRTFKFVWYGRTKNEIRTQCRSSQSNLQTEDPAENGVLPYGSLSIHGVLNFKPGLHG
jgi:hypothetical protein